MKRITSFTTLFCLLLISITNSSFAKVWRVNNNPGYSEHATDNPQNTWVFDNLQNAVDNQYVLDGDTLYVEASATTYGIVNLNKRLTIIGSGYFLSENTGLQTSSNTSTIASLTFSAGSSGSSLYGMRFFGYNTSIYFPTPVSNIIISRCYLQGSILFDSSAGNISNIIINKNYLDNIIGDGNSTLSISNLSINNNYLNSSIILKNNTLGTITQNVFAYYVNIYSGISLYNNISLYANANAVLQNGTGSTGNTAANVHHNIFTATAAQLAWLSNNSNPGNNKFSAVTNGGTGTIFSNFSDTTDKKYQLKPVAQCAICYDGFPTNTQIGMYGGNDVYKPSGIPAIPTIYSLSAGPNASQGGTLPVTISTRSNN